MAEVLGLNINGRSKSINKKESSAESRDERTAK